MHQLFRITCVAVLTVLFFPVNAQNDERIRFAKDRKYIYFFQDGGRSDSIITGKSDTFFYLVPDSVKQYIVLDSENAQFAVTKNDSILRCIYLPGMRYETFFRYEDQLPKISTGVNGTSTFSKNNILVQIIDRRTNKVVIENEFKAVP